MALLTKDLRRVRHVLYPAREKWFDIGIELKVEVETLKCIRTEQTDHGACLREMLIEVLQSDPQPTWEMIAEALKVEAINRPDLARKVEAEAVIDREANSTAAIGYDCTDSTFEDSIREGVQIDDVKQEPVQFKAMPVTEEKRQEEIEADSSNIPLNGTQASNDVSEQDDSLLVKRSHHDGLFEAPVAEVGRGNGSLHISQGFQESEISPNGKLVPLQLTSDNITWVDFKRKKIQELAQENAILKEELEEMKKDEKKIKQEMLNKEKESQKEIKELKKRNEEIFKKLKDAKDRNAIIEKKLRDSEASNKNLLSINKILQEENDKLENEIHEIKEQNEKMKEDICKLEQAYKDLQTKLNYMVFDKILLAQHEARIQQIEAALSSTSEVQIQEVRAKSEVQDQLNPSVMEFLRLKEEEKSTNHEKQEKSLYSASTSATQSTPNITYI